VAETCRQPEFLSAEIGVTSWAARSNGTNANSLRFFAGYAAKKWPPFRAAEALFQELRARRENELQLVLVLELDFESFERIADPLRRTKFN